MCSNSLRASGVQLHQRLSANSLRRERLAGMPFGKPSAVRGISTAPPRCCCRSCCDWRSNRLRKNSVHSPECHQSAHLGNRRVLPQDAQKGRSARPQANRNRRHTLGGTLRISMSRERSWRAFSASCYASSRFERAERSMLYNASPESPDCSTIPLLITMERETKTYVLKRSVDEAVPRTLSIDYRAALNSQQLAAVTAGEGPSLVIAGAGSGKTRTLVYRVAYLIDSGVDPSHVLLLTFTRKSSQEMLERAGELIGARSERVRGGTFHSVANTLLRRYGWSI